MASQQDVQGLLRLLTTGRNKVPMLQAMGRVKELQKAGLNSIADIASTTIVILQTAIPDAKAAKALLTACKSAVKSSDTTSAGTKRPAQETTSQIPIKKVKSVFELPSEPLSGASLEKSLSLPPSCRDEAILQSTVLTTNRAPLVLVFALVLLEYTMPEQPLSGRLSLAQAVCSANSRSKAVSLGIEKGSAEREGWGEGWPKLKVLGREISVLKRSGYAWKDEDEKVTGEKLEERDEGDAQSSASTVKNEEGVGGWTVSTPITSKSSTFIARSLPVTSLSDSKSALSTLLQSHPSLLDASHNITALRVRGPYGLIEDSNDDGESGGGKFLLSVLRDLNVLDVMLVVSRWYGGIMLGTDRWRIMREVARDALSQRLRVVGKVDKGEALWGLDLEGMKRGDGSSSGTSTSLPVHKPENARAYILKAFATSTSVSTSTNIKTEEDSEKEKAETSNKGTIKPKKRAQASIQREKEENLGKLIGALELLFESWVEYLGREELDRRAWSWYVNVRPEVDAGVGGWGGKGDVKLAEILKLRRKSEG